MPKDRIADSVPSLAANKIGGRSLSQLKPAAAVGSVSKSVAVKPKDQTGGSGGGIASPLTEVVAGRTYYTERFIPSSDGVFTLEVKALASVSFTDAESAGVVINYADPG